MKLIKPAHPETHEILNNARAALEAGKITDEQHADVVLMCFTAEIEADVLGHYPEVTAEEEAERYAMRNEGLG